MKLASSTITLHALGVFIGRKFLRIAAGIALVILGLLVVGVWLLASHFSAWWWILLLPMLVIGVAIFILYSLLRFFLLRAYPAQFSREQTEKLTQFVNKLTSINDARTTSPFTLVATSIWELIRYRELRTVRAVINNSSTLSADFERLTHFF